jgi:hypothetical protein
MRIHRSRTFCAAMLAVALWAAGPSLAQAQIAPETDPNKCGAINLAHLYLRCIHILAALEATPSFLGEGQEESELPRQAKQALRDQQIRFMQWITPLYESAGRKFGRTVSDARSKIDDPHVEAALVENLQRVRKELTGNRDPEEPNMLEECSARGPGPGLDIQSGEKVNERLRAFRQDAAQIAQSNASCIKEN